MCGIVGAFHPNPAQVSSRQVVEAMRDTMAHRGPDGAAVWQSPDHHCVLGHRRLSIIDLSDSATQPMTNREQTVTVVFNGEIYNHAALRTELESTGRYVWVTDHSDTEVLLHAYEEWGLDCTHKLYGMFAFAIYDSRNRDNPVLHLVRDRMGVKPLYFSRRENGEWLFASEIKAIVAHPGVTAETNPAALWHYLTFIVAPAPLTMFSGIFKLPSGWRMTIDHKGQARAERWYRLDYSAAATWRESDLSFDEACDNFLELMRRSVARRMVSDVPFGVLLSGGVDSSLNVALMSELMDRPVTSYSIGYQGHEQLNEFGYARRIANSFGTDHHERRITAAEVLAFLPEMARIQDEPIADNVCIPLYFLADLVKQTGTTVVQVGEGADEHFLGYWWCEHYREKHESAYAPARRGQGNGWWKQALATLLPGRLGERLAGEDLEFARRAKAGEPMFWGGAACFVGEARRRLTPSSAPFRPSPPCPVIGLEFPELAELDSPGYVARQLAELGPLAEPEILQQISFVESRIRLPEHLLMRVDKMTMAHSIEARVPFLDHDVVEFAARLPLAYKLDGGLGKRIVKKAAERFIDKDILYRPKQGFGAPVDKWLMEGEFGLRCRKLVESSPLVEQGFLNRDTVSSLFDQQFAGTNHSFHLFAILNAALWHATWIEKRSPVL